MTLRLTEKRNRILKVLQRFPGTLSAQEVHSKVPDIDLVTVYRNLDLFVKEKMITKVNLDTGEVLYEYQKEPHHHAVCTECRRVIHFTAPDEKIKKLLGVEDFEVTDLEVTIRGICNHSEN